MARLLSREREVVTRSESWSDDPIAGGLSIVTEDMRIEGDIETKGSVRIEGTVTGGVRARGVELAATGSVEGNVEVLPLEGESQVFVIKGSVKGAVRASRVDIGQGGRVLGGIEADYATLGGNVQGGILARERLALRSTAVVEGDVDARRLALEEGGQVNGNIRVGDRATLSEEGRPRRPGGVDVTAESPFVEPEPVRASA